MQPRLTSHWAARAARAAPLRRTGAGAPAGGSVPLPVSSTAPLPEPESSSGGLDTVHPLPQEGHGIPLHEMAEPQLEIEEHPEAEIVIDVPAHVLVQQTAHLLPAEDPLGGEMALLHGA